jgi:hypothetical protein
VSNKYVRKRKYHYLPPVSPIPVSRCCTTGRVFPVVDVCIHQSKLAVPHVCRYRFGTDSWFVRFCAIYSDLLVAMMSNDFDDHNPNTNVTTEQEGLGSRIENSLLGRWTLLWSLVGDVGRVVVQCWNGRRECKILQETRKMVHISSYHHTTILLWTTTIPTTIIIGWCI